MSMNTDQVNIAEAKTRFSELVQKAMLGEEVIVAKENKPVVKIVPIKPVKREPGTGKGIWMAADFDAPLEDFQDYR
ncbi:MAG: type II toxin-antitoxin system Phd/YefM family antitoxin [Bryobacteraceae bacterium]